MLPQRAADLLIADKVFDAVTSAFANRWPPLANESPSALIISSRGQLSKPTTATRA
jgi:hypothetical protein